jgi:type IX secretion system PorP/SprF family membrane protein
MKKGKTYWWIVCWLLPFQFYAQDIHFSQFMHNPLYQNPGNTGAFQGDYRFNAAYRDQWRSVTVPFSTFMVSADQSGRFDENLGIGLFFMHDVVGDGKFRTVDFLPSVSYRFQLDEAKIHSIRPGIQLGMNYREVRPGNFMWDAQYNGYFYNPDLSSQETFMRDSYVNFALGTGVVYEWFQSNRKYIVAGISVYNITRQNQGFFTQKIQRDRRLTLHGKAQLQVDLDWDVIPSVSMNFQGTYSEIIIGSQVRYILEELRGEYKAIYFGAFTRFRDAAYLMVGMDYQNWFAGLSYDFNYSKLTPASRLRGGVEMTLQYIFKSFKPKKINHRICPVYI